MSLFHQVYQHEKLVIPKKKGNLFLKMISEIANKKLKSLMY